MYVGEDYNEMEARFAVVDSIVKAICELTGCKVKLEESVKASDALQFDVNELPDVSRSSMSDYVLYVVTYSAEIKIVMIETKSDQTLSKNAISQLIGYYIASQCGARDSVPLGLVITQSKAHLVFFPYVMYEDSKAEPIFCVDAIVTEELDLRRSFSALISFATRYIRCNVPMKTIASSETYDLHSKKVFELRVKGHKEEKLSMEQKLKEAIQKVKEQDAIIASLNAKLQPSKRRKVENAKLPPPKRRKLENRDV